MRRSSSSTSASSVAIEALRGGDLRDDLERREDASPRSRRRRRRRRATRRATAPTQVPGDRQSESDRERRSAKRGDRDAGRHRRRSAAGSLLARVPRRDHAGRDGARAPRATAGANEHERLRELRDTPSMVSVTALASSDVNDSRDPRRREQRVGHVCANDDDRLRAAAGHRRADHRPAERDAGGLDDHARHGGGERALAGAEQVAGKRDAPPTPARGTRRPARARGSGSRGRRRRRGSGRRRRG